jgi:NAD(P)-dependent dehydrogenase (short-subunit alcohol dehydrogenase family)
LTNGSVINIGSVTSLEGSKELLDYSMAKGGTHAFTKALSSQLVPRGDPRQCRRARTVCTSLNPSDKQAEDVAKFGSQTPMKREAQPEEIAPAYVFLASPRCRATSLAKSRQSSAATEAGAMARLCRHARRDETEELAEIDAVTIVEMDDLSAIFGC